MTRSAEDLDHGPDPHARDREIEDRLSTARRLEVVGRLVGGVAHDFNNVLSVITTLSELLVRFGDPRESDREDLEEILAAARRGSELTGQLLAFVRADTGDPEAVDIGARMQAAEKLFRKLLPEDVTVELEPRPGVPAVWADPIQIDHLILNLAAAGREAVPEGGTVRLRSGVGRDGQAVLEALWEGRGSAVAEDPGREPTTPANHRRQPGLSGVAEILGSLGGRMSAPEEGVGVRIELPAATSGEAVARTSRREGRPGGGERPARARILLVEDDEAVRAGLARMLEAMGHAVVAVESGEEALTGARAAPGPDAVVCDVVLRDLWGPEVARRLGQEGLRLPFLYLSGHAEHPALGMVRSTGSPLLRKPVSSGTLEAALATLLEG